jgi:hypothetical protein
VNNVNASMPRVPLSEIRLLDVGHTIQLAGAIWSGEGKTFLVPLPGETFDGEIVTMPMNAGEWERFLQQSDVLDIEGPGKAILRKSQRHIDQHIAWQVYERDGYRCRYCGEKRPLTVDHVILWEAGGATVEPNLVSACRRCNKLRGSMPYDQWMNSPQYNSVNGGLTAQQGIVNEELVLRLPQLALIKAKPRSR